LIPVVIGSSAGGPKTLKKLLSGVDILRVPLIVAQHNLSSEVESFAKWIEIETGKKVVLVKDRELLRPGIVYLPVKDRDIVLAGGEVVRVVEPGGRITPSIDRLFESAAFYLKDRAVAIVLGGLGRDGVMGAKRIAESGGRIIVQSDPEFEYLPEQVSKEVERVAKRSLDEIILILRTMVG